MDSMHVFQLNEDDESRNKVEVFDFDIKGLSEKFDAKRFNRFCKTNG